MLLGNTAEIADACRLFANTMEVDVVWDSSQTMIRLGAASVYQRLHIVTESPRNVAVSSADPRLSTAEKIEHARRAGSVLHRCRLCADAGFLRLWLAEECATGATEDDVTNLIADAGSQHMFLEIATHTSVLAIFDGVL